MYDSDTSEFDTSTLVAAGASKNSGLGANETVVNYADNVKHDASIEEIFHLITQHATQMFIRQCLENRILQHPPWPKRWTWPVEVQLHKDVLRHPVLGLTIIQTAQQQVL